MLAQLSDASVMESWPVLGLLGRACLVVLGMVAVLWVWRRTQQAGTMGMLQVVEQRRLSANHSLFLVKVGSRSLLIGTSPQGLTTICELDPPMDRSAQDSHAEAERTTLPAWSTLGSQWPQSDVSGAPR